MILDKIELPDFVITNLFTDNLVVTGDLKQNEKSVHVVKTIDIVVPIQPLIKEENVNTTNVQSGILNQVESVVPKEKTIIFKQPKELYLGNNLKNITILVKDKEAVYLREEWLQFLTNILDACKLNIGDVAIINHEHNKINLSEILTATTPRHLIMFEVNSKEINLSFIVPNYQVQNYNNTTFLLAPSLSAMLGTTDEVKIEKTKLWTSLKKMFGI